MSFLSPNLPILPRKHHLALVVFILFLLPVSSSSSSGSKNGIADRTTTTTTIDDDGNQRLPSAILIDVDNTLYTEKISQIEKQIVENTHKFCREKCNLSPDQSDSLYKQYGTTIEGLRHTHPHLVKSFYEEVYSDVNLASLLLRNDKHLEERDDDNDDYLTGYSSSGQSKIRRLLTLLMLHQNIPLYLVSNSPSYHVKRVLAALGLSDLPFRNILTPDVIQGYPTKASASRFYRSVLLQNDPRRVLLLDDSSHNLHAARSIGMMGISTIGCDELERELSKLLLIRRRLEKNYEFDEVRYLRSKNEIDVKSLNERVWTRLLTELQTQNESTIRIVDLGAGRLSMLKPFLEGWNGRSSLSFDTIRHLEYIAYEPNRKLLPECQTILSSMGFQPSAERPSQSTSSPPPDEYVFRRETNTTRITVRLRLRNFRTATSSSSSPANHHLSSPPPHLIVGCCFADLFSDPSKLLRDILSFANLHSSRRNNVLLYFPITFDGVTMLNPPHPASVSTKVPSDTLAMRYYSSELKRMGHNLSTNRFVESGIRLGGTVLAKGYSPWSIAPEDALYDDMKYFFETSGMMESMMEDGWDGIGWWERFVETKPSLWVRNMDLLLRFGFDEDEIVMEKQEKEGEEKVREVEEIEFYAKGKVRKKVMKWDVKDGKHLGPKQVEVQSLYSLISTGTELKIFRGQFSPSSQLDTTISSMKSSTMSYPLSYGYSLVGRITDIGSNVPPHLLGTTIFAFHPHASRIISNYDDLVIIPDGIHPKDAVFFPSMETALSIVHDARIRFGERVGVFGQGLIGLLVTAILRLRQSGGLDDGTVTVFDTMLHRLSVAVSEMGASDALLPQSSCESSKFDTTIEVSGNPIALQSAIDSAKDYGRIVIASWYGEADVGLCLGVDFHRSHKTIVASQVSDLPAGLSRLWDKKRRFDLTWELVRILKPSKLISNIVGLEECQEAYEALSDGREMVVAFRY